MALNSGTLAGLIEAAWRAADAASDNPSLGGSAIADDAIASLSQAIADAVVAHITTSGTVTGTVVDPVSGVLPLVGGVIT